jgi:flap endonuclease-1
MGVEGFFKVKITFPRRGRSATVATSKVIAELGVPIKLSDLQGMKVAIDASLMIYSSKLAVEHLNTLTDSEGHSTVHINTIFNKILQLADAGAQQMWIFDSPEPNEIKKMAIEQRMAKREQALKKGYKNSEKIQYRLTKEDVNDIQMLLKCMGITYIIAPSGLEAEQYGAYLTKGSESERFCRYMITSDSDVLCFGGNLLRMTTQKSATGKTKKTVYQAFELEDVLAEMQLSYEQFLQMCVLLGTDFAQGTPGVGPNTVIDKVRKDEMPFTPRQELAMEYFKSDISDKIGGAEIVQGEYNLEELVNFLKARNFNEERIRKRLEKYNPEYNQN